MSWHSNFLRLQILTQRKKIVKSVGGNTSLLLISFEPGVISGRLPSSHADIASEESFACAANYHVAAIHLARTTAIIAL